jgi:hypothetical protein
MESNEPERLRPDAQSEEATMKRGRIQLAGALVAASLMATPAALSAQAHEHGRASQEAAGMPCGMQGGQAMGLGMMEMMRARTGMMGQGMGMMGQGGPSAAMILRQKEALGLSGEQVGRLEGIERELGEAREAHRAQMGPLHQQLMEAQRAEAPDLERIEGVLERLAEAHVQGHLQMLRLGQRAMEVLTSEQRANVRYGMRLMGKAMRPGKGSMMGSRDPGGGMATDGHRGHHRRPEPGETDDTQG